MLESELEAKTILYEAKLATMQAKAEKLIDAYIDDLIADIEATQGDLHNGKL